jgi:hypothetical protein
MGEFDRDGLAKKLADIANTEDGCSIFGNIFPAFEGRSQKNIINVWKLADEKSKELTKETGQSPVVDFKIKREPNIPLSEMTLSVEITDPRIYPAHQTIFSASRSEGFGFRGGWVSGNCFKPKFVEHDKK